MMIGRSHPSGCCFLSFKNYNGVILPPGAEPSWIPHIAVCHTNLLKSQDRHCFVIIFHIAQNISNSEKLCKKKKEREKSWSWIIQPRIIVIFLFFPFLTSFSSSLSIAWSIHFPPQKEPTSYRTEPAWLLEPCSLHINPSCWVLQHTALPERPPPPVSVPELCRLFPKVKSDDATGLCQNHQTSPTNQYPLLNVVLRVTKNLYPTYLCSLIF